MYIVITEIIYSDHTERWYYGTYTRERANEVALELGSEFPYFHCVIPEEEAEEFEVKNLPNRG